MIPQLVKERFALAPAHPPIQVQNASLVKAQQQDLPQPVAQIRLENPILARERAVDNAMQIEIYRQIRMQGKLLQSAENTHTLLIAENKALKQHIIERTESLEKEWLGVAEQLGVKVDVFYYCTTEFHRWFSAQNQEAEETWKTFMSCGTADNRMDYDKLIRIFQGNYFKVGAASTTTCWYTHYSHQVEKPLAAIAQMHLIGRDCLKVLVKAEIQKIKDELLLKQPHVDAASDSGQITFFNPNNAAIIDEGKVLPAFLQEGQEELEFLEKRNRPLRNENASLEKKKNELVNMDKRFLGVFNGYLTPCSQLVNGIKVVMENFNGSLNNYIRAFAKLGPSEKLSSLPGGTYSQEIQLNEKFKQYVSKIEPLVKALEKKDSP
jgi:hypothetical protein